MIHMFSFNVLTSRMFLLISWDINSFRLFIQTLKTADYLKFKSNEIIFKPLKIGIITFSNQLFIFAWNTFLL